MFLYLTKMGAGPSKIEKKAKSRLDRFINGIQNSNDRVKFQDQDQKKLYEILLAREKLTNQIDEMTANKKITKSEIMGFIEKNMDSFENYHDVIKTLTKKYGGKPDFVIKDLINERIDKYETEIRKKIVDRASRTVFGRRRRSHVKRSNFGSKRRSLKRRHVLKK